MPQVALPQLHPVSQQAYVHDGLDSDDEEVSYGYTAQPVQQIAQKLETVNLSEPAHH